MKRYFISQVRTTVECGNGNLPLGVMEVSEWTFNHRINIAGGPSKATLVDEEGNVLSALDEEADCFYVLLPGNEVFVRQCLPVASVMPLVEVAELVTA